MEMIIHELSDTIGNRKSSQANLREEKSETVELYISGLGSTFLYVAKLGKGTMIQILDWLSLFYIHYRSYGFFSTAKIRDLSEQIFCRLWLFYITYSYDMQTGFSSIGMSMFFHIIRLRNWLIVCSEKIFPHLPYLRPTLWLTFFRSVTQIPVWQFPCLSGFFPFVFPVFFPPLMARVFAMYVRTPLLDELLILDLKSIKNRQRKRYCMAFLALMYVQDIFLIRRRAINEKGRFL